MYRNNTIQLSILELKSIEYHVQSEKEPHIVYFEKKTATKSK